MSLLVNTIVNGNYFEKMSSKAKLSVSSIIDILKRN